MSDDNKIDAVNQAQNSEQVQQPEKVEENKGPEPANEASADKFSKELKSNEPDKSNESADSSSHNGAAHNHATDHGQETQNADGVDDGKSVQTSDSADASSHDSATHNHATDHSQEAQNAGGIDEGSSVQSAAKVSDVDEAEPVSVKIPDDTEANQETTKNYKLALRESPSQTDQGANTNANLDDARNKFGEVFGISDADLKQLESDLGREGVADIIQSTAKENAPPGNYNLEKLSGKVEQALDTDPSTENAADQLRSDPVSVDIPDDTEANQEATKNYKLALRESQSQVEQGADTDTNLDEARNEFSKVFGISETDLRRLESDLSGEEVADIIQSTAKEDAPPGNYKLEKLSGKLEQALDSSVENGEAPDQSQADNDVSQQATIDLESQFRALQASLGSTTWAGEQNGATHP